jgi:hypothetical protein
MQVRGILLVTQHRSAEQHIDAVRQVLWVPAVHMLCVRLLYNVPSIFTISVRELQSADPAASVHASQDQIAAALVFRYQPLYPPYTTSCKVQNTKCYARSRTHLKAVQHNTYLYESQAMVHWAGSNSIPVHARRSSPWHRYRHVPDATGRW